MGLTSVRVPSSSMARSSSFVTMSRCSVESARYIEQIRYVFVQYTEQVEEGLDARRCEPLSVRGGFRGACSSSTALRLIDEKWLVGVVELDARSVMVSAGLNRLNVVGCKCVFAGDSRQVRLIQSLLQVVLLTLTWAVGDDKIVSAVRCRRIAGCVWN